ncbi:hypothetical protein CsSME_00043372 [Camellia sinensis var. sinensis]
MKELSYSIIPVNHLLPKMHKTPVTIAPLEEMIFGVAFVTAFAILQLPYKDIDGNSVPTILFTDKPSFFHAFLLALNFAFTGAVMTIYLREGYPKIAKNCRCFAIVSISAAVGVLVWLVLPAGFQVDGINFMPSI